MKKKLVVLMSSAVLACGGLATGLAATATATPEVVPTTAHTSSQPPFSETKSSSVRIVDTALKSKKACDPRARRALLKMRKGIKAAKNPEQINAAARKAAPAVKKYTANPHCA